MESLIIQHIVSDLLEKGEEEALCKMINEDTTNTHVVVFLSGSGHIKSFIHNRNCEILPYRGIRKLIAHIKMIVPDVIHAWGHRACAVSVGLKLFSFPKAPIFWSLQSFPTSKIAMKFCSLFSFVPKKIIYSTGDIAQYHQIRKFPKSKTYILPHGFDLSLFIVNDDFKQSWRETWLVDDETKIIGTVGRYTKEKDYGTLFEACALLHEKGIPFKLILIGEGLSDENLELMRAIHDMGLKDNVLCMGAREDTHLILPVFDFAVQSSSKGEVFPSFLCEAMACGVPCIATNVGGSKRLVDDYGIIVPSQNPEFLSKAIEKMFSLDAKMVQTLRDGCRQYIIDNYSSDSSTLKHLDLYKRFIKKT